MKSSPRNIISVLCLGILLLNACSRIATPDRNGNSLQANQSADNPTEKNSAQIVKDDVEELGRVVRLPFVPEETTWREDNIKPPNEKKLTAILRFSAEDADNVVREAEKHKPGEASEVDAETWFPAELIAQSQLSGDETLKGAAFSADDFLQPPFKKGKLTRIINTGYFVLELTTF